MKTSPTIRRASVLLVASLLASIGCKHDPDDATLVGPQDFTIELTTPPDVPVTTVALGANGSLTVGRGSRVLGVGTAIPVATNMGARGVAAGSDSTAGDIWSASPVEVNDRARVMGSVHAAAVVTGTDVLMARPVDHEPKLAPPRKVSWKVGYSGSSSSSVSVGGGEAKALSPGQYGSVGISSTSTLTLRSGTYLLEALSVDGGGRIRLNQGDGPVYVYVRGTLRFAGAVESASGGQPDLVLVYLATGDVAIESPFTGTFVATQGKVTVRSPAPGFSGALFAPDIDIADGVTVTFGAPNGILRAAAVPLADCLAMMFPAGDAQGRQGEIQYQEEILRTCTGAGLAACERTLVARVNADDFAAAQAVMHGTISPATYLAYLQDHDGKLAALRGNEQAACAVVADDPDGDLVATVADDCPATPDFTPTLANGCTQTNLPAGPTTEQLKQHLGYVGISTDPRCATSPAPVTPAPLGAWRHPPDSSVGKALWISRSEDSSGCPVYYELEADLTDGRTRHISVKPSDDTTLSWIKKPATAVQINIRTGDGGDRGAWASYSVYTVRYRARALSGSGRRSDWSQWFSPGFEDCVPGIPCAD